MRSRLNLVRVAAAAALCSAAGLSCKAARESAGVKEALSVPGSPATMCLSIMGNGNNLASHLGAITALFERNIDAKVIVAGSSGSVIGPAVLYLLQNPSLRDTVVIGESGSPLSIPQKAARIVSVLSAITDSLSYPLAVNDMPNLLRSMVTYQITRANADAFIGDSNVQLGHLEAITGQAAFSHAFLKDADLAEIISDKNAKSRYGKLKALWFKTANFLVVPTGDFVNAMLNSATSEEFKTHPTYAEIRRRYFQLLRLSPGVPGMTPEQLEGTLEAALHVKDAALRLIPSKLKAKIFQELFNRLKRTPLAGMLSVDNNKPYPMIDPTLTWAAFEGKDLKGQPLPMPKGQLIHTTALNADRSGSAWSERMGRDNLYQGYMANPELTSQLRAAKAQVPADRGFLEYPKEAGGWSVLMDARHVFINEPKLMIQAMLPTVSEPNSSRREPIAWYDGKDPAAQGLDLKDGTLVTYGGWMERVGLASLARLTECQPEHIDYMVQISGDADVNDFQRRSIRKFTEGLTAFLQKDEPSADTKAFMNDLLQFIKHAKAMSGGKGHIGLEFDWNHPSSAKGDDGVKMDKMIQGLSSGMAIVSYQAAVKVLDLQGLPPAANGSSYGDISGTDFGAIADEAAFRAKVAEVLQDN